jgi:hypothetical protein
MAAVGLVKQRARLAHEVTGNPSLLLFFREGSLFLWIVHYRDYVTADGTLGE